MRILPTAIALAALTASLHATTVYTQTFESESLPPEWTGAGSLSSTEGLNAFGFGLVHLQNNTTGTTTLTLLGLPQHDSVTIDFSGTGMWLPGDHLDVALDHSPIPEPTSWGLAALALAGLGAHQRLRSLRS